MVAKKRCILKLHSVVKKPQACAAAVGLSEHECSTAALCCRSEAQSSESSVQQNTHDMCLRPSVFHRAAG